MRESISYATPLANVIPFGAPGGVPLQLAADFRAADLEHEAAVLAHRFGSVHSRGGPALGSFLPRAWARRAVPLQQTAPPALRQQPPEEAPLPPERPAARQSGGQNQGFQLPFQTEIGNGIQVAMRAIPGMPGQHR